MSGLGAEQRRGAWGRCGERGAERLCGLYRLWHQLTLQVLDFVQDPCFAQGDGLIKVRHAGIPLPGGYCCQGRISRGGVVPAASTLGLDSLQVNSVWGGDYEACRL